MINMYNTRCCGVFELDNVSTVNDPIEALRQAAIQVSRLPFNVPFITFTGVVERGTTAEAPKHIGVNRWDNYGQKLADAIVAAGLGIVVASEPRVNWSDNTIRLWIWHVDHTALDKYVKV